MYFVTRQHSLRVCHHGMRLFIYITRNVLAFHWILSKGALSKSVCVLWISLLPGALQLLNLLKCIVYFNLVCTDKKEGRSFRLGCHPSCGVGRGSAPLIPPTGKEARQGNRSWESCKSSQDCRLKDQI